MTNQELSRFAYLFEPADDVVAPAAPEAVQHTSRYPSPPVLLAAVLLGVGLGAVLLWPRPVDALPASPVSTPSAPTPPSVTTAVIDAPLPTPLPSQPSAEPAPPPVVDAVPRPSRAPVSKAPVATPTTRAPISVRPTPRPAFPDQHPRVGSDGGGGFLGGLL